MKIFYVRFAACYVLCFFGLMSCSSEGEKESVSTNDIDEFRSYSIDPEKAPTSFFNLIEEVEVMRLEETPESLLPGNAAFIGYSKGQYFLNGWSKPDIHVFKETGGFVRKINHKGEGPEEYTGIHNFWVKNDRMGLYGGGFIVQYDLDGRFISKEKPPIFPMHAYAYEGGYAFDVSQDLIEGPTHYSIMLLDSAMGVKSLTNPSKRHRIGLNGANSFADYKNTIVYHDPFSDTVFVLEDEEARPLFNLDFGKKWAWQDESMREGRDRISETIRNKDLVWVSTTYVGSESIFAFYRRNPQIYVLIDRKTGEYRHLDFLKSNGEKLWLYPMQWEGDRILCTVQSTDVADIIEELGAGKMKFREGTTLEEIESSENPVLMWVKFKALTK